VGMLSRQVVAGLVVGVFGVSLALSFATLIFAGELAPSLGLGAGWILAGYVVIGLVAALTSSFRGLAAGPQDAPAVLLAAAAAGIAANAVDPLPTLATFIIVTTSVTGLMLILMGRFRLGDMVRYVPFPVVAGFLGGTGLLLLIAGISQLFGSIGGVSELGLRVVPGLALGVFIAVLGARDSSPAAPVVLIVTGFVGYHLAAAISNIAQEDGIARGLLLGPFPEGRLAELDVLSVLASADWNAVLSQSPVVLAMVLIVPIAVLLNLGGVEQTFSLDLDVDRELTSTGAGMVAAAPFAGIPGYVWLSVTIVGRRLGDAGRLPPLVASGLAAVVLFAGADLASLVPVFIPAGLLVAIGLGLMIAWLWDVRTRVTPVEHIVVLVIVVTIGVFGFLPGVGLGVVAATGLFVVRYARTSAVRAMATISERRSSVQRNAVDDVVLAELGKQVVLFELQGYLFFGTTEQIVRSVRKVIDSQARVDLVLIDLRRVTGMDSSATASFDRLARLAENRGFRVVFCGGGGEVPRALAPVMRHEHCAYEPDLDKAMEMAEEELLASHDEPPTDESFDWSDTPRVVISVGEPIITEGDNGAGIFFLESGRARVDSPDPEARRAVLLPGAVIGELSYLTGDPAMATVVAHTECVVRHMTPGWLVDLARRDPQRALELERLISHRLAVKLTAANRTIGSLL
jgi:sulfate permease, SulP family